MCPYLRGISHLVLAPIELAQLELLPIRARMWAQCCVPVSHFIVMVAHRPYYCTSTRTGRPVVLGRRLAPSALPASCSLPRCALHAPYNTRHHITSSVGAAVRPCATNSLSRCEPVSTSRLLSSAATGCHEDDRGRQCCGRLAQPPGEGFGLARAGIPQTTQHPRVWHCEWK